VLQRIHRISPANQLAIRSDLEQYKDILTSDVSQYAPNRKRAWLDAEWDLKHKRFIKAHPMHDRLRVYLQKLNIPFDLALIAYGASGISWHRDDSYANFVAYSVNLSTKPYEWGYQRCYPSFKYEAQNPKAKREIHTLQPGEIIKFNCKNPHAALDHDDERWSINLWTVKPKYKSELTKILAS